MQTPMLPTGYRPDFAERACRLCKAGMTDDEIACQFEIPLATLLEWKDSNPDFAEALRQGRGFADGDTADGLHRSTVGASHPAVQIFMPSGATEPVYAPYTRHYPPNPRACEFWLINRRPQNWRAKVEAKPAPSDDTSSYSDAQLTQLLGQETGIRPAQPAGGAP